MNYELFKEEWVEPEKEEVLKKIKNIINLHKNGLLGGDIMPEDANPGLPKESKDNFHFFTFTMALNYQRNSYKLWPAATQAYNNPESRDLFSPEKVVAMPTEKLRKLLIKSKIGLQPNKHVEIWNTICLTTRDSFNGDIRNLFVETGGNVRLIKEIVQIKMKKNFPYLSGEKIFNYWLYVMEQYSSVSLKERELINVAPDTHVIQSSFKLGIIDPKYRDKANISSLVSNKWTEILKDTEILPIDIHTPLWLWSRSGFKLYDSL